MRFSVTLRPASGDRVTVADIAAFVRLAESLGDHALYVTDHAPSPMR